MFKLYSKACEHAIWALAVAGAGEANVRFQAKEVCEAASLPEPITRKVLQELVQSGLLEAIRGPGGGYRLTRPASEISLVDFIKAVDGVNTFGHCVLGFPVCNPEQPCPLHEVWSGAKEQLLEQLRQTTLRDVVETVLRQRAVRVHPDD